MKYRFKFSRVFEVDLEADGIFAAEVQAADIVKGFRKSGCAAISIIAENYVEPPDEPKPPRDAPRNKPPGGSPGTPTVNPDEPLVDQIAEAA
jgi:hypothetical protein